MNILQVSTHDIRGGAARATNRLHCGLRNSGQDCRMLVRHKETDDKFVTAVKEAGKTNKSADAFFLEVPIQEEYINRHRTDLSNTLFSLPYPGYDISRLPLVESADIINLHWISQFQSIVTLGQILALHKPVVWTLHDQWAFTGGCHYSAGCRGYETGCRNCPQLSEDPFSLPEIMLKDKDEVFKDANLTIVTPSRWMAECVGNSRLFNSHRIEVIPNSLETDLYAPLPQNKLRERLDIPESSFMLLFGAVDGAEKRKGFSELVKAMAICLEDPFFMQLLKEDRLRLLCFGDPDRGIEQLGIPVASMGRLNTDQEIREAYCAADVFLLPSLEDNLPNTILESMSCGTPVVAFDVGGVSDAVSDGVSGLLAKPFDHKKLAEAVIHLAKDAKTRLAMGEAARKRAVEKYALTVQSKNYLKLYEELLNRNDSSANAVLKGALSGEDSEKHDSFWYETDAAYLNTTLGPGFRPIYDDLLFHTLKLFTPDLNERWCSSETDRLKRLAQVENLTDLLKTCETDRAARLEQLKSCEKDREARLQQVGELTALLETCEADRAARLELINSLTDKINNKRVRNQVDNQKLQIQRLEQRALFAERGWRILESTQVVKKARKVGLIKLEKPDFINGHKNDV